MKTPYLIIFLGCIFIFGSCSKDPNHLAVPITPTEPTQEKPKKEEINFNWLVGEWAYTSHVMAGNSILFNADGTYGDSIEHNDIKDKAIQIRGSYNVIQAENAKAIVTVKINGALYDYVYEILDNTDAKMKVFFYLHYLEGSRKGEKSHNMTLELRKLDQ